MTVTRRPKTTHAQIIEIWRLIAETDLTSQEIADRWGLVFDRSIDWSGSIECPIRPGHGQIPATGAFARMARATVSRDALP